ncbi:MAG: FG-GAP-like repeat-containing protein [Candidatus Helarchaeota archaeon]|nr:FG-GAP-like repeat-containing protein [Candidatus Helarchaeota archaeon]
MNRKSLGILILLLGLSMSMLLSNIGPNGSSPKLDQIDSQSSSIILTPALFNWDSALSYPVGDNPLAVAFGDVNNDGKLDLVTANNDSGSISILIWNMTLGNWVTKDWSLSPGVCALAVGDANNDGLTDIAAINRINDQLHLLLWNISKNNWTQINYAVGDQPTGVVVGDANDDHLNEIVVANYADDNLTILLWNVTTKLWSPRTNIAGDGPVSVEIGDIDSDGAKEIVVASYFDGAIRGLQWNESIKGWNVDFTRFLGYFPSDLAIGDADNDGATDILVVVRDNNSVAILTWNSQSRNWIIKSRGVDAQPSGVTVGDANADGQNDIITANYGAMNVSILLWNSILGNWEKISKLVGAGPTSVIIADVNNNGLSEIATADSLTDSISILLWNTTSGALAIQKVRSVGFSPIQVAVGDANNDGEEDIVTANVGESKVTILCWNTSIGSWNPELDLNVGAPAWAVDIGDANNDGTNDIVACSASSKNASIILWNKTTKNWNPFIPQKISEWGGWDVVIADVNNDGANDITVANKDQTEITILFWNKTSMVWNPYFEVPRLGTPFHVAVEDINNDGFNDLVASGNGTYRALWYYLWNSSVSNWTTSGYIFRTSPPPAFTPAFSVGDVNNDGMKDIVVGNFVGNNVSIYLWNVTSQGWNVPVYKFVDGSPGAVDIGDVNNDGQNDIVTTNNETGRVGSISTLLWNTTLQNWQLQAPLESGYDPRAVVIEDATNDGAFDVIVANLKEHTVSILPFNRYPYIISRASISAFPQWTQAEDFGSFMINLTGFGIDAEEKETQLSWVISGLNQSLIQVNTLVSTDNLFTFNSIANLNGIDTFQLSLQDSYGFQDSVFVTVTINPVNDNPIILSENQLRSLSIWTQSRETTSFAINLSSYESDAEDQGTALKWFVQGLNSGIATVQGENSTNDTLTFFIHGTGSTTFTLFLMDSDGTIDSLTITLVVNLSLADIIIRIVTPVLVGVVVVIGIIYWRLNKIRKARSSKSAESKPQMKTVESSAGVS